MFRRSRRPNPDTSFPNVGILNKTTAASTTVVVNGDTTNLEVSGSFNECLSNVSRIAGLSFSKSNMFHYGPYENFYRRFHILDRLSYHKHYRWMKGVTVKFCNDGEITESTVTLNVYAWIVLLCNMTNDSFAVFADGLTNVNVAHLDPKNFIPILPNSVQFDNHSAPIYVNQANLSSQTRFVSRSNSVFTGNVSSLNIIGVYGDHYLVQDFFVSYLGSTTTLRNFSPYVYAIMCIHRLLINPDNNTYFGKSSSRSIAVIVNGVDDDRFNNMYQWSCDQALLRNTETQYVRHEIIGNDYQDLKVLRPLIADKLVTECDESESDFCSGNIDKGLTYYKITQDPQLVNIHEYRTALLYRFNAAVSVEIRDQFFGGGILGHNPFTPHCRKKAVEMIGIIRARFEDGEDDYEVEDLMSVAKILNPEWISEIHLGIANMPKSTWYDKIDFWCSSAEIESLLSELEVSDDVHDAVIAVQRKRLENVKDSYTTTETLISIDNPMSGVARQAQQAAARMRDAATPSVNEGKAISKGKPTSNATPKPTNSAGKLAAKTAKKTDDKGEKKAPMLPGYMKMLNTPRPPQKPDSV